MIQNDLNGKTVFKGKSLEFMGIKFRIRGLYAKDGSEMMNGFVKIQATKVTFLSRSS